MKVFDDATLVAERHKSPKAHDRLVAAARALHPDIYQVSDLDGAPGPHVGWLMLPTRPEPFDAARLAEALVEFAHRLSGDQVEGRILSDGHRILGLRYTSDGTSATLVDLGRTDTVLSTGTLIDVLAAAAAVVVDDYETDQVVGFAEAGE